jgi:uncharacterized membrane protein required for colicin V production
VSHVDLIAIVLIVLTALAGFRRGLVTGLLSLGGLVGGAYIGARVGPSLIGVEHARWLPLVALGGAVLLASAGQSIGVILGGHLRRGLLVLGPLRVLDNVGGSMLGAATGLAICWVVGAVLLYLPGQTKLRSYVQESSILTALNEQFPPGRLIDQLGRIDPFTAITGPQASVEAPDATVLGAAGVNAAAPSVVRVVGNACGLGIEGSGWVAGPGLVVTNAHVVAGVDTPRVDRGAGGAPREAKVVSFDRTNDVAVLRVRGLRSPALRLAEAGHGTTGALLGYPGNGPYTETPVRIGKNVPIIGRDAYGRFPTSRVVTTVRGTIRSGNSGGPIVDAAGAVIATVFAKRAGSDGGYAVPTAFVRAALARAGTRTVHSACVDR